jgi:chemotaxis protein methyltransferase CheR
MIYFAPEVMRGLLRGLKACLAPGGWLLVGHAEPYFEIANHLSPVTELGPAIYRKLVDAPAFAAPLFHPQPDPVWTEPAPVEPELLLDIPPPPPPKAAVPAAATLFDQVRALSDAGDWDDALALCERALQETPLDPAVHYTHALLSEHAGAQGAVADALRNAIYLDRNFALAHYRLGCLKLAEGARKAGARALQTALKILDPRAACEQVPMGDGLTVGELRALIQTHIAGENDA